LASFSGSPPPDVSGGGSGGSVFAPLYDEITLDEIISGEASLLEIAEGKIWLNEIGSAIRSKDAATASLLDIAHGDATATEQIHGFASVFEH
jgi:hypothetical protein